VSSRATRRRSAPHRPRYLSYLAAAVTVAVVAVAVLLVGRTILARDQPPGGQAGPPGTPATAEPTGAGQPVATGSADREARRGSAVRPAAARVAAAPISVRYTFDGGPGRPILDTDGGHPLRVAVEAGGAVAFVGRDAGQAVGFPPPCAGAPASCPRSILEGVRDDELNPGTRPVRFGATVRMTRADTSDGANVVQKGYSVGGGTQFKLQVDGAAGRPSCVVASAGTIYRTVAPVRVADGEWHQLTCARTGSALTITVDGVVKGSIEVPPELSIVTPEPLRVGGKGANAGNDQYSGRIDDVFLTIT
ncbi:MAG TPA: LamG-like jellyroll fold domain-containing protein, partial [Catenuloplanes sp.]